MENSVAGGIGAIFIIIIACLVVVTAILWIAVPFILIGANNRLDKILNAVNEIKKLKALEFNSKT